MAIQVRLTLNQINLLKRLWFIYGNKGKKHSHCNHRFIQNFIECGEDTRDFYLSSDKNDLTQECINEVDKILKTH